VCACVGEDGGVDFKTDEYVKIYEKKSQQSDPKVAFLFCL